MDINEFKNMVIPFKNQMYRLAKRLLKEIEEAEDSVQDAFVKLWQKRIELDINKNLQALSMMTVKNICLDKLKAKRMTELRLVDEDIMINNSTPLENLFNKDLKEQILNIIENLPEQQKIVFQLRDIEGFSNEEVAEMMKLTNTTVRTNLSRARKKVRELLVKNYRYEYYEN